MIEKIKHILDNQLYAISLYARQIAGTVVLFIIARYLSVYEYGLFSSYKAIATFCLLFANLGYSEYILVSSNANVDKVKSKISLFVLNSIFITTLIAFISSFFNISDYFLFSLVVIRTFFDVTFFALILPYFQATKNFNQIAIINIVYAVCVSVIATASFVFKLSLFKFLVLNIILGFVNFIQCSYYAKINYILCFTNIKKYIKMLDKSIWAYIGVLICSYLYGQIPSLYVSGYLPKEQAALYFSAFTIANVIALLISAQTQKMVPEMINVSVSEAKQTIRTNLKFMSVITGGVFLFSVIFGKILLRILYGQVYYAQAYPVLLMLMAGNICVAEAAVFGAYITASGNQKKKIPMQIKATFVTLAGIVLFRKFGVTGATFAYLSATIYISVMYTTFTLKLLKQKDSCSTVIFKN